MFLAFCSPSLALLCVVLSSRASFFAGSRSVCTSHCLRPLLVPACSKSTLATHPTTCAMKIMRNWVTCPRAFPAQIFPLQCERLSWSPFASVAQPSFSARCVDCALCSMTHACAPMGMGMGMGGMCVLTTCRPRRCAFCCVCVFYRSLWAAEPRGQVRTPVGQPTLPPLPHGPVHCACQEGRSMPQLWR